MADELTELTLEPLPEADPRAVVVVGDFVRFDTSVDVQPVGRLGGIRFDRIIAEFNANSAMVVSQTGQQNGVAFAVTRRDGRPSGVWPMVALVKVTAPVTNPAPPMVPDALP